MKRFIESSNSSTPKRCREASVVLPPGARLLLDFVSPSEEKELLEKINSSSWNTTLKRRTQHYGVEYDYKSKWIADAATASTSSAVPLPAWCLFIVDRLKEQKLISTTPDQLLVNEYEPGQGISRHTDSPAFDDIVLSLSLSSPCVMKLARNDKCIDVALPRLSLLVLSGEARWQWTHEIPGRKSDVVEGRKVLRSVRVSLTFRWVRRSPPPSAAAVSSLKMNNLKE